MEIIGGASLVEVFSALGPPIIAVFAWLSYKLNKKLEADIRKQRELEKEPYLIAYLAHDDRNNQITNLIIANVGKGVAQDVRIDFGDYKYDMDSHGVIIMQYEDKELIYFLPSGKRVVLGFGTGHSLLTAPERFCSYVKVSCKNLEEEKKEFSYLIDVNVLEGRTSFSFKGEKDIAKAVEDLAKSIKGIIRDNRIRVETITKQEVDEIREEQVEQMRRFRERGREG